MLIGLFVIGGLVGFLLSMVFDELVPRMVEGKANVNAEFAKQVLQSSAREIRQGNVYKSNVYGSPLRSYPLLVAYILAALLVITSSTNFFGKGVVLGIGLCLVLDLFLSRTPASYLRQRWFSVFRTNLSDRELQYFVWGVVGVFGVLTLLSVVL